MPTIKEYTTWKFEEADDDLKEKIYEKYRYFNVEDDWWHDYDGKTGFFQKRTGSYFLRSKKIKQGGQSQISYFSVFNESTYAFWAFLYRHMPTDYRLSNSLLTIVYYHCVFI